MYDCAFPKDVTKVTKYDPVKSYIFQDLIIKIEKQSIRFIKK